jgi:NADPH-dependent curcumin reductase CurA
MPKTTDVNRQLVLVKRPTGMADGDTVGMRNTWVPAPGPGEALARVRFLSIDPAIRTWMADTPGDLPPIEVGDVVRSAGVAEIVGSNSERYRPGDLVFGMTGWQDYVIADEADRAMRVLPPGIEPTAPLGVLGINGLTAYFGMLDVGRVSAGAVVVVSGAAGATGSIAGQIARIKGAAKVIGIAGGPDKCKWIVDDLGFDEAIDYRAGGLETALQAAAPQGIDLYYDNVGGSILDACLANLAHGARVVLCGFISGYNATEPITGPANYPMLIFRSATMAGFEIQNYADRYASAQADIVQWIAAGRLKSAEHVIDGLERAPDALNLLFSGANTGKLVVRI